MIALSLLHGLHPPIQATLTYIDFCPVGFSMSACGDLLHMVPVGFRQQPASLWVCLGCRKMLCCTWSSSCPPSALTLELSGCCLTFLIPLHSFLHSLPAAVLQQFFLSLYLLSQRHTQHHSWFSSGSSGYKEYLL